MWLIWINCSNKFEFDRLPSNLVIISLRHHFLNCCCTYSTLASIVSYPQHRLLIAPIYRRPLRNSNSSKGLLSSAGARLFLEGAAAFAWEDLPQRAGDPLCRRARVSHQSGMKGLGNWQNFVAGWWRSLKTRRVIILHNFLARPKYLKKKKLKYLETHRKSGAHLDWSALLVTRRL